MNSTKELLLEDDEILKYLENDLTEERAWRVQMALKSSLKMRQRLWAYQWLKRELSDSDLKGSTNLVDLHNKIMKNIDEIHD